MTVSFSADEIAPGGPAVSVLSHQLWRDAFGADRSVLGKQMEVYGILMEIVGVMPPEFELPRGAQLWVNDGALPSGASRTSHNLVGLARLAPGVSRATAQAEASAIAARIRASYPEVGEVFDFELRDLHRDLVGDSRATVLLLSISVGLVLLIACVNLACLLLAQAIGRSRELAVRRAVGAGGGRLVRQVLTESGLLGLGGAGLGLWLCSLTLGLVNRLLPPSLLHSGAATLDWRVLSFALAVGLVAGVGFGIAPAIRAMRAEPYDALLGERSSGAGRRKRIVWLVLPQYGLSLAVLIMALLLTTSLRRLDRVDEGMTSDSLAVAQLVLPRREGSRFADSAALRGLLDRLVEEVGRLPGVRVVTLDQDPPLTGSARNQMIAAEGREPMQDVWPDYRSVGSRYFETTGIPLIAGRDLGDDDFRPGARTVVVNADLARILWGSVAAAVGKRLRRSWQQEYLTVVGVAADVRTRLEREPRPAFYHPWVQLRGSESMWLVVATPAPATLVGPLRRTLAGAAPDVPIGRVTTMAAIRKESIATPRLRAWLLGGFGAVALLLAVLGVYGVLSYAVAQRRQEIAIRRAIGADRRHIEALLGGEALRLVLAGQVAGLALALGLGRVVQGVVFGVSPREPAIYLTASLVMAVTVLLTCYLPARRAGRVEPLEAMRQ